MMLQVCFMSLGFALHHDEKKLRQDQTMIDLLTSCSQSSCLSFPLELQVYVTTSDKNRHFNSYAVYVCVCLSVEMHIYEWIPTVARKGHQIP